MKSEILSIGVGKGATGGGGGNGGEGCDQGCKKVECFNCGGNHYVKECPKVAKGSRKSGSGQNTVKGGKITYQGGNGGKNQSAQRPAGGIRNAFRKYRTRNRMGCPWAHAIVPPKLQNVEGLVLSDIGNLQRIFPPS